VKEWKRVVDPVTKIAKPFGFCTWTSPHGALAALRLLQGLQLDGGALELKPGKNSEQIMDTWLSQGNSFSEEEVSQ
jgi:hypothetical protein